MRAPGADQRTRHRARHRDDARGLRAKEPGQLGGRDRRSHEVHVEAAQPQDLADQPARKDVPLPLRARHRDPTTSTPRGGVRGRPGVLGHGLDDGLGHRRGTMLLGDVPPALLPRQADLNLPNTHKLGEHGVGGHPR